MSTRIKADPYESFCKNFFNAIKAGNDTDADKEMESAGGFYPKIIKLKPFDYLLESLMESTKLPDKEKKMAKMCSYLVKQSLSTPFSQLCYFGASIQIKGEKPVLSGRKISWYKEEAKSYISIYETFESPSAPRTKFMTAILNYKPPKTEEKVDEED